MFARHRRTRQRLVHVGLRLAPAGLAQDAVREAQLAVRTGADAEVVAEVPVVQVVDAAVTRPRVGRDLVARQAGVAGQGGDAVQHLEGEVVFGQARRRLHREARVRLQRQVIDAQVRWLEGERPPQVALAARQVLAGQRVHQVDVESVEGTPRLLDRGDGLGLVVHAAQQLELRVVEALHADRQPRDAGRTEGAEALALEGPRIGLERDLAVRQQWQTRADVFEQPADRVGREQAGRAAADEDADDAAPPHERQRGFEIGAQRIEVAGFLWQALGQRFGSGFPGPDHAPQGGGDRRERGGGQFMRVEVAVRALLQAPRQVNVERQRGQRGQVERSAALVQRADVDPGRVHVFQCARISASISRAASARWLAAFFSSDASSATLRPSAGMNISGS